jgi:hypothetical protein
VPVVRVCAGLTDGANGATVTGALAAPVVLTAGACKSSPRERLRGPLSVVAEVVTVVDGAVSP